jgi:hypothetical protein
MKTRVAAAPEHAPFTDSDKRRLRIQLRLWKPGLSRLPTEEDYIELTGWYEAWLDGGTFGDDWRQYRVQYLGWQLDWQSNPLAPDWYMKNAYALGIRTPEKPDKPMLLCGVRIHHTESHAFAEILFGAGDDSLDSIQNAQACKSPSELMLVWRGFELFKQLQKDRGPQPEYSDGQTFIDNFIKAYVTVCLRSEQERCSIEDVAEQMLLSRQHWYDYARKFGRKPAELKREARQRLAELRQAALVSDAD